MDESGPKEERGHAVKEKEQTQHENLLLARLWVPARAALALLLPVAAERA